MHNARTQMLAGLILALAWFAASRASGQQTASDSLALTTEFERILESYVTLPAPPLRGTRDEYRAWREQALPLLDHLVEQLADLAERSQKAPDVLLVQALVHAKRASIYLDRRREHDAEFNALSAEMDLERLRAERPDLLSQRALWAELTAQEYGRIEQTLSAALERADMLRERREMALVQGVILAQSAIVRDRAVDSLEAAERLVEWDPAVIRTLLDESEGLLQSYLTRTPPDTGLEWVRGYFYLGVVQYRRSLQPRVVGKEYVTAVDPQRREAFEAARAIFQSLSDPQKLLGVLRPEADPERQRQTPAGRAYESSGFFLLSGYPYEAVARYYAATSNLYLGLIAAIDPQYETDPQARLEAAQGYLNRARELDSFVLAEGQPPQSLTQGTIPLSCDKVEPQLVALTQVPAARPLNDLTISFGAGILYDTNVTLLGRNTSAPLDLDRKRDFRAFTGLRLDYIADLNAFDPANEFLRRWQVRLQGRVSSTWNARIHTFNEQYYGGSANIRYELLGPGAVEKLDNVYMHVRYDYDQIMLGNDGFLVVHRVRPMLQVVAFGSVLDSTVYFSYERRNYLEDLFDDRFNREGDYFGGGFDFRLDLGNWVDAERLWGAQRVWGRWGPREDDPAFRRPLQFLAGLEFTSNSTAGDEFDYSSAVLTAGVELPLPWGIDFLISGAWEWQDYWQPSRIDRQRRPREDFIQEYGFRAERKFYLTPYERDFENVRPLRLDRLVMTIYGDIRFTIDDSNVRDRLGQSVFEYNRIMYGAGVRFDLN